MCHCQISDSNSKSSAVVSLQSFRWSRTVSNTKAVPCTHMNGHQHKHKAEVSLTGTGIEVGTGTVWLYMFIGTGT